MKRPGIIDPKCLPRGAELGDAAKVTVRHSILMFALVVLCLGLLVSLLGSGAARSDAALLATGATPTPTIVPCPTPSDPFSTANPC